MFEFVHHVAYAVDDMDKAISDFENLFGLKLKERKIVRHPAEFEMATFQCGETLIEFQRPINHPGLARFLEDRGPGLSHVAFAVKNLPAKMKDLEKRGVAFKDNAIMAGTGWLISEFDLDGGALPYFRSPYHDDHLADAHTV